MLLLEISLNPCFCGRWSLRYEYDQLDPLSEVVLILVFVEDGHWVTTKDLIGDLENCLNPCFCGRWSLRRPSRQNIASYAIVLILVFVEDGHWVGSPSMMLSNKASNCLNPCFCGRWSLSQAMEYSKPTNLPCLNPCFCGRWSLRLVITNAYFVARCLNPCFCGRWSLSRGLCVVNTEYQAS